MLVRRPKMFYFLMYLSAAIEGLGMIVLGAIVELAYRFLISIGYSNSGLEWLLVTSFSIFGLILIIVDITKMWLNLKKNT